MTEKSATITADNKTVEVPVLPGSVGPEVIDIRKDVNNPTLKARFHGATGGSTGRGSQTTVHLPHTRALAPHVMLAFATHDILNRHYLLWRGILPDMSGIGQFTSMI